MWSSANIWATNKHPLFRKEISLLLSSLICQEQVYPYFFCWIRNFVRKSGIQFLSQFIHIQFYYRFSRCERLDKPLTERCIFFHSIVSEGNWRLSPSGPLGKRCNHRWFFAIWPELNHHGSQNVFFKSKSLVRTDQWF